MPLAEVESTPDSPVGVEPEPEESVGAVESVPAAVMVVGKAVVLPVGLMSEAEAVSLVEAALDVEPLVDTCGWRPIVLAVMLVSATDDVVGVETLMLGTITGGGGGGGATGTAAGAAAVVVLSIVESSPSFVADAAVMAPPAAEPLEIGCDADSPDALRALGEGLVPAVSPMVLAGVPLPEGVALTVVEEVELALEVVLAVPLPAAGLVELGVDAGAASVWDAAAVESGAVEPDVVAVESLVVAAVTAAGDEVVELF